MKWEQTTIWTNAHIQLFLPVLSTDRGWKTTLRYIYGSWFQICSGSLPTPTSLTWQLVVLPVLSPINWAACESSWLLFTSSASLGIGRRETKYQHATKSAFLAGKGFFCFVWSDVITPFLMWVPNYVTDRTVRSVHSRVSTFNACHQHSYRRGLEEKIQRNLVFLKSSCILI